MKGFGFMKMFMIFYIGRSQTSGGRKRLHGLKNIITLSWHVADVFDVSKGWLMNINSISYHRLIIIFD